MDFNFLEFILQEALILVPVLIIIGWVLKNSPLKDWLIPWMLLVLGVVFSMGYLGLTWESFFQGVLVFGAAVGIHQLYKQTKEGSQSV